MNPQEDLQFHDLALIYYADRKARGQIATALVCIKYFGIRDSDINREFFGGDE